MGSVASTHCNRAECPDAGSIRPHEPSWCSSVRCGRAAKTLECSGIGSEEPRQCGRRPHEMTWVSESTRSTERLPRGCGINSQLGKAPWKERRGRAETRRRTEKLPCWGRKQIHKAKARARRAEG